MPFAEMRRGISLGRQQLGQRGLAARQALWQPGRHRLQGTRADGMAPRHQGRARGHAVAFHVEVLQQQSLAGQLVDARSGRAAQRTAAVAAQLAPAQVVRDDEHDIWWVHDVAQKVSMPKL